MAATTTQTQATQIVIPEAHREAAKRYIAAIVQRDPITLVGGDFVNARNQELWDRFETGYVDLSRGPYSRHGADALHRPGQALMPPVPSACSHCGRTFSADERGARLAHLERHMALCDRCVWFIDHPESVALQSVAERQGAA